MTDKTVKAIIFDMDGTLWDSAANVAKSWNEILSVQGISDIVITEQNIKDVMGLPMDVIAAKLFPEVSPKRQMELMDLCGDYENEYLKKHGGKLYPELVETLGSLSESLDLYIVSNCQKGYIESFLEYYGFEKYFKDKLCWGDTNLEKGETIKLLMEKNNISKAYYVGDTQGDCDSAAHAGIGFIHAAYGFGQVSSADAVIEKFSDLCELFRQD